MHVPQSCASETHRTPHIHRISKYIEGKSFYAVVHQNAKVVSEKSSSNAKSPGRGDYENLAGDEKGYGKPRRIWLRENGRFRLVCERTMKPIKIKCLSDTTGM